jgi:hypothetical protein
MPIAMRIAMIEIVSAATSIWTPFHGVAASKPAWRRRFAERRAAIRSRAKIVRVGTVSDGRRRGSTFR